MATERGKPEVKRLQEILLAVLFSLSVLAVPATAADAEWSLEEDWHLEKEKDGISIFTREIPDSPFLAVKATTSIPIPVAMLAEFLGDGSECMPWRKMCESSRVLEVLSEDERLVYQVLDLPWPISDRDMVIRTLTEIDPATRTVTVSIETHSDAFPPQKYTRAETNAQMQLREIGAEATEFNYVIHADLGGNLSPGLINPQLVSSTFDDVQRLIALATQ